MKIGALIRGRFQAQKSYINYDHNSIVMSRDFYAVRCTHRSLCTLHTRTGKAYARENEVSLSTLPAIRNYVWKLTIPPNEHWSIWHAFSLS
jgi:hypothetical protein